MSNPIEEVRQELVGFELEALSLLLYFWAEPVNVEKRKDEWGDKITAFRKAIIASKSTGTRRKLEPEIIQAEFECLTTAVEYVQSERKKKPDVFKDERELVNLRIPYRVDNVNRIFRPFPVPRDALREIWIALRNRSNDLNIVIYHYCPIISRIITIGYEIEHFGFAT